MVNLHFKFRYLMGFVFLSNASFSTEGPPLLEITDVTKKIFRLVPCEAIKYPCCKAWYKFTKDPQNMCDLLNHFSGHIAFSKQETLDQFTKIAIKLFEKKCALSISLDFRFTPSSWNFLMNFPHLRELKIGKDIKISISSISHNTQLNKFIANGNNFEENEKFGIDCKLPILEYLHIRTNRMNNNAYPWIRSLTSLKTLEIFDGYIDAPATQCLASLTSLEVLYLDDNAINNEALAKLTTLTNLTSLNLSNNEFNIEKLEDFSHFTKLQYLSFFKTSINSEEQSAITRLKRKLPNLKVNSDRI